MSIDDLKRRFDKAMHAMQSGVAYSKDKYDQEPKHLRVGVNNALRLISSVSNLLVAKGLITEDELWRAIAEGAEAEARGYEDLLTAQYGREVKLL